MEPYFGGGAVLLHKKNFEDTSEVINDLNGDLMNFWMVLRSTPDRMLRQLWATPFSEPAFDAAFQDLADQDNVRRATAFFIRVRQSRQGLMKDFATLSKGRIRGGMNEQVSAWWSAVEGLPEVHDRLKRVVIYNRDALEVIQKMDSPDTLFYLDPPYMHETRSDKTAYGKFEMTEDHHAVLLRALLTIRGKFLLSGYNSELYRRAAVAGAWKTRTFDIANNASSAKEKEVKTEFLWSNF